MRYERVKDLLALAASVGGVLVANYSGEVFLSESNDGEWIYLDQGLSVFTATADVSSGWEYYSEARSEALRKPSIMIDGEKISIAEARRRADGASHATN
jgi:hypothetical protein